MGGGRRGHPLVLGAGRLQALGPRPSRHGPSWRGPGVTEAKLLARLEALMLRLSDEARVYALIHLGKRFGRALTSAERMRLLRQRRDAGVTCNGPEPVTLASQTQSPLDVTRPSRNVTVAGDASVTPSPRVPPVSSPGYSPAFLLFWTSYPKRVGKGEALRSWKRQGLESKATTILEGLERNRAYMLRDDGKFIPNPATFLNQNRWEDDPPIASETSLLLSEKTRGNAAAAREFVRRNQR